MLTWVNAKHVQLCIGTNLLVMNANAYEASSIFSNTSYIPRCFATDFILFTF